MPWSNAPGTRRDLPDNWDELVAACKKAAGYRCEWRMRSGRRCPRRGTEVDHYGESWEHDKLRLLCRDHHNEHTQEQAQRARNRKPTTRRRPHPGRLR